jgi:hypothetical protein
MSKRRKNKISNDRHDQQVLNHRVLMLEELFLHGPPVNNTTFRGDKQIGNLSNECLQYITHRVYQGWKPSQIADSLGIDAGGVKFVLNSFHRSAMKFYEAKVVERIKAPDDRGDDKFLCRIHGEQFRRLSDANNHCWAQLFADLEVPDESVQ